MTQRDKRSVTLVEAAGDTPRPSPSIPTYLQRQAVARLRVVAAVLAIGMLVGTFVNAFGNWLAEFRDVLQWGPVAVGIVSSLLIIVATRVDRFEASEVVTFGLVYEVIVSYAIVFAGYWGTFDDIPVRNISPDLGWSPVAVWIVFYTIMVPAAPRRALIALLVSAGAVPIGYLVLVLADNAPGLSGGRFFQAMVAPYLATAGLAYVAVRVVYGLARDVGRAREMGSYRLEARLGSGAMGEVWRASHRMLARPAAIKLIRRDALGNDAGTVRMAVERFEREAQATASLRSQHTVELYDFGTAEDGTLYYVMELLEGIDLDRMIREFGPLCPARTIYLLRQACDSLAEAHRAGLIHRDVKPANLYVCRRGLQYDVLKVLDFGLVRRQAPGTAVPDSTLSRDGAVLGTPAFMAPEMVMDAESVQGAADLYALGCVAYWMLTGRYVFDARSVQAMLFAHVNRDPDAPSRHAGAGVSPELDAIVLRCLAKRPADRFSSAEALSEALDLLPQDGAWSNSRAAEWWAEHRIDSVRNGGDAGALALPVAPAADDRRREPSVG